MLRLWSHYDLFNLWCRSAIAVQVATRPLCGLVHCTVVVCRAGPHRARVMRALLFAWPRIRNARLQSAACVSEHLLLCGNLRFMLLPSSNVSSSDAVETLFCCHSQIRAGYRSRYDRVSFTVSIGITLSEKHYRQLHIFSSPGYFSLCLYPLLRCVVRTRKDHSERLCFIFYSHLTVLTAFTNLVTALWRSSGGSLSHGSSRQKHPVLMVAPARTRWVIAATPIVHWSVFAFVFCPVDSHVSSWGDSHKFPVWSGLVRCQPNTALWEE